MARGGKVTKWTPENKQKLREMYAQGCSDERVAKYFDISVGTVQNYALRFNAKRELLLQIWDEEKKAEFERMYNSSIPISEIAKHFKIAPTTAMAYAYRFGIKRNRRRGKKAVLDDEDNLRWFKQNYPYVSNVTCAVYLGISEQYIKRKAGELNLYKKNKGEATSMGRRLMLAGKSPHWTYSHGEIVSISNGIIVHLDCGTETFAVPLFQRYAPKVGDKVLLGQRSKQMDLTKPIKIIKRYDK